MSESIKAAREDALARDIWTLLDEITDVSDPRARNIEYIKRGYRAGFDAAQKVADEQTADLRNRLEIVKEAIRKLDSAMDMQEKRETEEFHIPQRAALNIWQMARQVGREALKELQETTK